tara:strand:- start:21 stop:242 length:222 start_codon:yes stop_codon:yes gene_type:complete
MFDNVVMAIFTTAGVVLVADHLLIVLALHDFLAIFFWWATEKKQGKYNNRNTNHRPTPRAAWTVPTYWYAPLL